MIIIISCLAQFHLLVTIPIYSIMSNAIKILDEATDILSECLKYPEHLTPYIKKRIDNAQELLLDWLVDLKQ